MQKRELWKVIVYGIITLGIYDLVWLYKTRNELVAKGGEVPSFWLLFSPLVLFFISGLILLAANSVTDLNNGTLDDSAANVTAITLMVIAGVLSLLVSLYWFYKYSQAVEKVTDGQTTAMFSFGMWALFTLVSASFVWPALIQNGYNQIGTEPRKPHAPLAATPA
jgi:low temperature requirement protein LtrA